MTDKAEPAPPTLTAVRFAKPIRLTWQRSSRQPIAYSAHVHLPCSRCGVRFWHALAIVGDGARRENLPTTPPVAPPAVCPACAVPWWRRLIARLWSAS